MKGVLPLAAFLSHRPHRPGHALQPEELTAQRRALPHVVDKRPGRDTGLVLLQPEVGVVVQEHPPRLGAGVVHRAMPDTSVPQDGVPGIAHQPDVVRHVGEVVVPGYPVLPPVEFVASRYHAEGRGVLVHVLHEEKNLNLQKGGLARLYPFPGLPVFLAPSLRLRIKPGCLVPMPRDMGFGAGRFDVQGIVAHLHIGPHKGCGDGDSPGMLQQVDEDVSVRCYGEDHLGGLAHLVGSVVRPLDNRPLPFFLRFLLDPVGCLLHARQLLTLENLFDLHVSLVVKKCALFRGQFIGEHVHLPSFFTSSDNSKSIYHVDGSCRNGCGIKPRVSSIGQRSFAEM